MDFYGFAGDYHNDILKAVYSTVFKQKYPFHLDRSACPTSMSGNGSAGSVLPHRGGVRTGLRGGGQSCKCKCRGHTPWILKKH